MKKFTDGSRRRTAAIAGPGNTRWLPRANVRVIAGVVFIALVYIVPVVSGSIFLQSSMSLAALTVVATLSVCVMFGWAGQFMFAQGAVFGTAAYVAGYLTLHGHSSIVAVIVGTVAATAVGLVILIPVGRLSHLQVGLLTYALGVAAVRIFAQISSYNGVGGLPYYRFGGWAADTASRQLLLGCVALLLVYLALTFIRGSRFGRRLLLMKADPGTLASMGISPLLTRVWVFAIGSAALGVAGSLYPAMLGYIGPQLFDLPFVISLLLGGVIGGLVMLEGGLVGGLLVGILPLIFLSHAEIFDLANGAAMVIVLIVAPTGLVVAAIGWLASRRRALLKAASRSSEIGYDNSAQVGVAGGGLASSESTLPRASDRASSVGEVRSVLLSVSGVGKSFGGVKAVTDVTVDFLEGGVIGLIGSNGAGKSTLVDLLAGRQRSDAGGLIRFCGDDVTKESAVKRARRGLTRTFQFPCFAPELTVLENVAIGPTFSDGSDMDRALEVLTRVGFDGIASDPVGTLPFGTQKLIDVCRAIATRPKLLLLDEPAAGMGYREIPLLEQLLRSAAVKDGITLVVVEHNMEFLMGLADHVVVLDYGRLIAEGSPQEVVANAEVQAAYLGTPMVSEALG